MVARTQHRTMYTIDNSINTLQDIVAHIHSIHNTDVMIWNAYCAIVAARNMEDNIEVVSCFDDDKIYHHCHEVLVKIITTSLDKGYYSELCWAGIRETIQKRTINDDDFFLILDKHLLVSDKISQPKMNETMARSIGCNDIEFEHIKDIYDNLPILEDKTVIKIFDLMTQCLKELGDRGILSEYISADK